MLGHVLNYDSIQHVTHLLMIRHDTKIWLNVDCEAHFKQFISFIFNDDRYAKNVVQLF